MPFRPCPLGCGRSVFGWRTRSLSSVSGHSAHWSCVRGWLMRLLWAYEHDIAAISPFLSERIGTLCRHPPWSLWLEQRTTGWRSGRSEGHSKSFSAGLVPTDLLLLTQRASRPAPGWFCWFFPRDGQHIIRCAARRQYVDRSIGGWAYVLWGWRCGGAAPSGVVATAAPDPELTAMLARAAASIGLEVNRPPSPEPSRLDDWFLGADAAHNRVLLRCLLPGGAWGADEVVDGPFHSQKPLVCLLRPHYPRWRGCHLCPRNAATWRNRPRLPSKACKLTAALAAKDYSAAGQAASALHAMAILQVHQAKALKEMHEGSYDPGLMQELRTATDLALRATKVTARSPRELVWS